MASSTNLNYEGSVKVSIKNKEGITLNLYKNEGTITLKKAFAMFLTGHGDEASIYLPALFDMRVADLTATSIDDYTTNIKKVINLQDLVYKSVTSHNESTYAAIVSVNLPHSSLVTPIDENKKYALVVSCSSIMASDTTSDLAYIYVPASDLVKFVAGTELMIEWQLKILNTAPEE